MEQIEQQVTLYDFLYKDVNRLASYYAQLFKGKLLSLEKAVIERRSSDTTGKLDLHLVSGDRKITSEFSDSDKRTIDPHDLITVDVLSFLMSSGFASDDVSKATHGSLVIVKGTLSFIDRFMVELAIASFDALIAEEQSKPKSQQNRSGIQSLKTLRDAMTKLDIPSAFILYTDDAVQIAGTIKESGMEEAISSYYFKHGTAGLSECLFDRN